MRITKMEIKNAVIESTKISMADHDILTITVFVKGDGWCCGIGGYLNGIGHIDATEWKGNGSAIVAMMKIMDVVGVTNWDDLPGKHIRVKIGKPGETVDEIGNIIKDKWFNLRKFYEKDTGQATFMFKEKEENDEQMNYDYNYESF